MAPEDRIFSTTHNIGKSGTKLQPFFQDNLPYFPNHARD
jgi:hypothetical protein